jgi:hypothetical protein
MVLRSGTPQSSALVHSLSVVGGRAATAAAMARPSSPLGRASATAKTPSSDAPHGRGGSRGATGKAHGAERAAAGGGARRGGGRERRRERRVVGLVGELEDRGRVRGRRDDAHHDPAGRVGVVSRGARREYGDGVVREEVQHAAEPVAPRLGKERPARRRRDRSDQARGRRTAARLRRARAHARWRRRR